MENNKLICPFCQQELKYDAWNEVYMCRNPNCKHLNRNFIGIELDPNYFEIAKNRIEKEPTQLTLEQKE